MISSIKETYSKESQATHQLELGILGETAVKLLAAESNTDELDQLALSLNLRNKLTRKSVVSLAQVIKIAYEEVDTKGFTQADIFELYDALTDLGQREPGDELNLHILQKNIILPRRIEVVLEASLGKPSDEKLKILEWVRLCLKHVEFRNVDVLVVLTAAYALMFGGHKELLKNTLATKLKADFKPAQIKRVLELISFYRYPQYARAEDERILIEGVTLGLLSTHKAEYQDEIKRNWGPFPFHSYAQTAAEEMATDENT
ncbi:hypothetical protein BH10PAT2_BH10PAT2_3520 [soil metagenome]